MMSHQSGNNSPSPGPPAIASWLVDLFTSHEQSESILGDLHEEFAALALEAGLPAARRWYWRQSIRTIGYLTADGFRGAPLSTMTIIAGGFLLMRFASNLPEQAIAAILHRYQVYQNHFDAYLFWMTTGIDLGILLSRVLVSGMVAMAARGREVTATLALAFIFAVMSGAAIFEVLARTGGDVSGALPWYFAGDDTLLLRLPWYFADCMAIVVGGVIVRLIASVPENRHAQA